MDKGFLIEILQMYKDDEQSVGSVLIAIDEYIQQQVKNLTIHAVMLSLRLTNCISDFSNFSGAMKHNVPRVWFEASKTTKFE